MWRYLSSNLTVETVVGGAAPNVCPSNTNIFCQATKSHPPHRYFPRDNSSCTPPVILKSTGRHRPMSDTRDQRPPKKPARPGALSHPVNGRRRRADALERQQRLTRQHPLSPAASADRPRGSAHRLSPVDGARTTSAGMPAEYGQSPPSRQPRCGSVQYLREPKILADHRAA
jgi:hypothetical protein